MVKQRNKWIFGAGGAALAISLAVAGLGTTGAYFSDTDQGNINGSIGSIKVVGSGGDGAANLDLHYTNLMPGEPQTVTASYTNNGTNKEDVYVVFNNADALHALNDLGSYGEFHVSANGASVFNTTNPKDNGYGDNHCPVYVEANNGCWPVPRAIKVASNLTAGMTGNVSFTFAYTAKLQTQLSEAGGGDWNYYPVATLTVPTPKVIGSGLPYQIVAVQAGSPAP